MPEDEPSINVVYSEAREALSRQVENYRALENKIGRHFTALVVIAGTFAISLPTASAMWEREAGFFAFAFAVTYLSGLAATFAGAACLVWSLRYMVLKTDTIGEDFIEKHRPMSASEARVALAKGSVDAVRENKLKIVGKEKWAGRGFKLLLATLALTGLSLTFYVVVILTTSSTRG